MRMGRLLPWLKILKLVYMGRSTLRPNAFLEPSIVMGTVFETDLHMQSKKTCP